MSTGRLSQVIFDEVIRSVAAMRKHEESQERMRSVRAMQARDGWRRARQGAEKELVVKAFNASPPKSPPASPPADEPEGDAEGGAAELDADRHMARLRALESLDKQLDAPSTHDTRGYVEVDEEDDDMAAPTMGVGPDDFGTASAMAAAQAASAGRAGAKTLPPAAALPAPTNSMLSRVPTAPPPGPAPTAVSDDRASRWAGVECCGFDDDLAPLGYVTTVAVLVNITVLCAPYRGMPEEYARALDQLANVCAPAGPHSQIWQRPTSFHHGTEGTWTCSLSRNPTASHDLD